MSVSPGLGRPGNTCHVRTGPASSTSSMSMPARARARTVISTWGIETTRPGADTNRGSPMRGATSSSAERNWDEAEASTAHWAPRGVLRGPRIVKGRRPGAPSWWTRAPMPSRAPSSGARGLARAAASPSKRVVPPLRAARGGRKRMTVPASPQSMAAGLGRSPMGVTRRVPPWGAKEAPICSRASRNRRVSRASRAPRIVVGASETAAR